MLNTTFSVIFKHCAKQLHFQIYCALRRRRNVMGPNATAAHQQQLNEDNR